MKNHRVTLAILSGVILAGGLGTSATIYGLRRRGHKLVVASSKAVSQLPSRLMETLPLPYSDQGYPVLFSGRSR